MTIQMTIEPITPSFVVGEALTFRLTIMNSSAASITVPDPFLNEIEPVYAMTFPDGHVQKVNLQAARTPHPLIDKNAPLASNTTEIPAQKAWTNEIRVDPMLLLNQVGKYQIQATMSVSGELITTHPAAFAIEAAHVTSFAWSISPPCTSEAKLFTVWAHKGLTSARIVESVRMGPIWGNEKNGKLYANSLVSDVSTPIGQVVLAEPLFVNGMDFHNWVAWTEPGIVSIARSNAGKLEGPVTQLLKTKADVLLIGPMAMDSQYNVRLYLIERTVNSATLVRLDIQRTGSGAAQVIAKTALPFVPQMAVALHHDKQPTVIFMVFEREHATVIAVVKDDPSPQVIELKQLGPLLHGRPLAARRAAADGQITIECLAGAPNDARLARLFSAEIGETPIHILAQTESDWPEINPTETRWVSLAATASGLQVLARDMRGIANYRSGTTSARNISDNFNDTPIPELFSCEGGGMFLAGVHKDGSFFIESLH